VYYRSIEKESKPPQEKGCSQSKTPLDNAVTTCSAGYLKTLTIMMTPILTKTLSADGFQWNEYSPRVATITNEMRHFAPVVYFAFDTWDEAHNFWKSITDQHLCGRAQVRESERFASCPWEVKVWTLQKNVLEKLIERDLLRQSQSLPVPPIRRDWSLSADPSAIAYEAKAA